MSLDDKQLRLLVLKYLRGHLEDPAPVFATTNEAGTGLFDAVRKEDPAAEERTLDQAYAIFHELVGQSIIVPGKPDQPYQWPHFRITAYGRALLARPLDTIVEPSAYVDQLRARAPHVSPIAVFYARHAVQCVRGHDPTAAAIMLACACEVMLREFTDGIISTAATEDERRKFAATLVAARDIGPVYRTLWRHLEPRLLQCPKNLRDQVDRELEERVSVSYHLVRRSRDDKGRPMICDFTEDEVYSNLLRFPSDAELLYGLIDILRSDAVARQESAG